MMGKGSPGAAIALRRLDHGTFLELRAAGTGDTVVFLRIQLQNVIDTCRLIVIGDLIGFHEFSDRFEIHIPKPHFQMNADDLKILMIVNLRKVAVTIQRIQQKKAVLTPGNADGNPVPVFDHLIVKIGLMYFSKDCFQHSARPPFAFLV